MMKKLIVAIAICFTVIACKSEKKESEEVNKDSTEETKEEMTKSFEDQLIDLREVDGQLVSGFNIDKFGMLKMNDSLYAFVFKLNPDTNEATVSGYSLGLKGFESTRDDRINLTFNPEIKERDGENYLIMANRKLVNMKYFDSLDVYVYERDNWKGSGRLGSFMIRDILFIND